MNSNIKKIIIILFSKRVFSYVQSLKRLKYSHPECSYFNLFRKSSIITRLDKNDELNFSKQFLAISKKITINKENGFVYPYDDYIIRALDPTTTTIVSVTPDYSKILESRLDIIKQDIEQLKESVFKKAELNTIYAIERIAEKSGLHDLICSLPKNLNDAIQKILFYNALFWQCNHWHNGCGRLDLVLYPYYKKDIENNRITRDKTKELLKEMILILGKDTRSKSASLIGDTGQYILLGGVDKNNILVQNELTLIILEILTELNIPDPKLILRVNNETNDEVWMKSIDCICNGCGSPLIMNESLVSKGMIQFGYKKEDVWNLGTSACWEPLVIGKSFDQNNPFANIPVIKCLNNIINKDIAFQTFDELVNVLKKEIEVLIRDSTHDVKFDVSPLFSLFFDNCINREKDFSLGGAEYSWHGIQIVSLPNLINSLINIKKYVFDEKLLSLSQCKDMLVKNFEGYDDVRKMFLSNHLKYGSTDDFVISLTNDLQLFMSDVASKLTINGNKIKIGFSSSQYIARAKDVEASLDGRKAGDAFAVHISPVSQKIDIQEVLDFAGKLDYGENRMNGNVVDFILPTAFINNKKKLITILKNAMTCGVYELQLNVLDSKTLIDAKKHPEKYPHLIVRVWGFSAYFNDLPEDYKTNLISRACSYER